jgi:hypothetical protein
MAQTNILCPVTVPASFTLTESDPMYYTELTNWIIGKNIEAMAAAGLQWSDGVPDDLESAWGDQSNSLNQQTSILTDLASHTEALSSGWQSRITALQSQISTLLSLTMTAANFLARVAAVGWIEAIISTMVEIVISSDSSGDSEELANIRQAIEDLKYNDEILELPATPRPVRIHLKGKTIQQ